MSTPITAFSGPYRFLSNFYPSPVTVNGNVYPTVEHAFQASKTTNAIERRRIWNAPTPGVAKRLGRQATLRPDWEAVKIEVMRGLLIEKFEDPVLYDQLRSTDGRQLIEGNTWGDRFWGECPVGHGENWLGRLLMEIRDGKGPRP